MGMFTILLGEVMDYVTSKHAGETIKNAPSKDDATGKIDNDGNGKPDFIINHDDPRYIESQKTALAMRDKVDSATGKTYGELLATLNPKNPSALGKIAEIEEDIVKSVNAKVHEQFGDYDKDISEAITKGLSVADVLVKHNEERDRANTENPKQLKELGNDELNCRHYSALANDLLAQAGMKVTRITGISSEITIDFEKYKAKASKVGYPHDTVMSALTGNIAEFTVDGDMLPYRQTHNKITPQEFEKGVPIPISQFISDKETITAIFFDVLPKNIIDRVKLFKSVESENNAIAEEHNKGNPKILFLKLNNTPHRPETDIPDHVKDTARTAVGGSDVKYSGTEPTPPPQTPTEQVVSQQAN
jgi:hypothetical protein